MNKPSEKAMQLVGKILELSNKHGWGDGQTWINCANAIDAHTAEATAPYKKALDEATDALCAIKDLSNLDHMARARSLALGALDTIRAIKGE